jgi:hypothetical protein
MEAVTSFRLETTSCFFRTFNDTVLAAEVLLVVYGVRSEFLATDPEARVRFPALPGTKKVVGLERGPLSLVSTTEELLDRNVAAPV